MMGKWKRVQGRPSKHKIRDRRKVLTGAQPADFALGKKKESWPSGEPTPGQGQEPGHAANRRPLHRGLALSVPAETRCTLR